MADLEIMNLKLAPDVMALCRRAADAAGHLSLAEWARVALKREAERVLAETPEPVESRP